MIKSKLEKIEKAIFISERKFKDYSNLELSKIEKLLSNYYFQKIKDKKTASEYKELFLDNPTMFEIFDHSEMSRQEMLALLERQRDWEIKHEKSEQEKDVIVEQYEKIVKALISLRKL